VWIPRRQSAPPGEHAETLCDARTKTYFNDDLAEYYDYALGTLIKFQLHDNIARDLLKQEPRECNYHGAKHVGTFLGSILSFGGNA
jgi:peptidyl-dipeptidase A